MSKLFDVSPLYYNTKEVKIIWECEEFGLAEVLFIDIQKTMVVDIQTITFVPTTEHYISINLLSKS